MSERPQVLVVEDQLRTLAGTLLELEDAGIDVSTVASVDAAIKHVLKRPVDLVLLDWRIPLRDDESPHQNGAARLLEFLSSSDRPDSLNELPVVVVTESVLWVDSEAAERYSGYRGTVGKLYLERILETVMTTLAEIGLAGGD